MWVCLQGQQWPWTEIAGSSFTTVAKSKHSLSATVFTSQLFGHTARDVTYISPQEGRQQQDALQGALHLQQSEQLLQVQTAAAPD